MLRAGGDGVIMARAWVLSPARFWIDRERRPDRGAIDRTPRPSWGAWAGGSSHEPRLARGWQTEARCGRAERWSL